MVLEAVEGFMKGVVKPVLDKIVPDAKDRLEAEQAIFKGMLALDMGQMEINKIEAASSSVFVAGWRPFIGWVCGGAYAYNFVVQPFLVFAITAFGVHLDIAQLPQLNWTELGFVLAGLLGLSTLRSYEKTKGV